MNDNRLSGMNVLIAEDEALVAMDLADMVEFDAGCVIGPFPTISECRPAAESAPIDVAILDVRLLDGEVFAIADTLRDRGIPIVFHSGHLDPREIVSRYPDARCCTKPATHENLIEHLVHLTAEGGPAAAKAFVAA
ncbi:response regulator [Fulvimarina sp. 2208YS6-2-32]|uniref:Response regulator n=1 Tax=Fulvimarina uroteuthidis TaxID=3098149 RepID=A0ABU5I3D2_9HYPH|nr:response regulator [Fulvimarina sp. 2208YS6-2-32]MDY8109632.1 response regulator [Fulvimarina sp. 2208YS6-2-32]